ncbi:MAG: cytochrome b N-terminal domain-containing protein [Nitrososphaerota archaeon]|nr:cytochrome b N-terminal domain-containing protein [Nitrososphaerota archaeon]MDG7023817.1 cytochrome b N-terminal domain-containing protein [Nitrososphaerota archaeon]
MTESDDNRRPRGQAEGWVADRVRRTILPSYRLLFPRNRTNPMTYLGLLTFVSFIVLALSGVGLMLYYSPDFTNSYSSVSQISSQVPFGLDLRDIHYYASDLMVLLALAHFFYLYFAGRYRFHNEVLWVTGVIFGFLTVIDAYTGYVLVMNERAMFAANIGLGLLNSISPSLQVLLAGNSYADLVLRVYTLHIMVIPLIMGLLVLVHFPRVLTIDLPVISWVTGATVIVAGLFPVPLGQQFVPNAAAPITVPEWYLSGIYAFLRTGLPVFVAGVFLPFLLLFLFTLIPFYDRMKTRSSVLRKLIIAFGVAVVAQAVLVAIWGVSSADLGSALASQAEVVIDPATFWGAFLLVGSASMLATWFLFPKRIIPAWTTRIGTGGPYSMGSSAWVIACLAGAQIVLLALAVFEHSANPGLSLVGVGVATVLFGLVLRVYLDSTNGKSGKQVAAREIQQM